MSKPKLKCDLGIGIIIVIVFAAGIFFIVSNLQHGKSPEDAYKQGYEDASWFVVYDVEPNPTIITDNLGRTWHRIDSTDTMPAVDLRVHPKAVTVPHGYPERRLYPTPLPAVERDSLIICTVSVEVLEGFYRSSGIVPSTIMPDTGGAR
jgi:hypothetical protein